MIDPTDIINFSRTTAEKEEFLLFCIFVANKKADQTAIKLDRFLETEQLSPFEYIKTLMSFKTSDIDLLDLKLKSNKIGQYKRIGAALREIVNLDLDTVTREELIKIKGIGIKTASFFLSSTRPNCNYLILDVHIFKALKKLGLAEKMPINYSKFLELEKKWLEVVSASDLTASELDLEIWRYYAGYKHNVPTTILEKLQ